MTPIFIEPHPFPKIFTPTGILLETTYRRTLGQFKDRKNWIMTFPLGALAEAWIATIIGLNLNYIVISKSFTIFLQPSWPSKTIQVMLLLKSAVLPHFLWQLKKSNCGPRGPEGLHHTFRLLKVINVAVGSVTKILLRSSHLLGRDPADLRASCSNEAATDCCSCH